MTPEAAIYQFLNGFGIPAYAESSVPDQAAFPYITYSPVVGEWGEPEVNMPVNVWYRTDSEATPNAKVREIGAAIGRGGVTVPCDGGMLWVKKGSPWAQAMTVDGEDEKVKRRYVNINIEYLISG
jgi:hypothetical protein